MQVWQYQAKLLKTDIGLRKMQLFPQKFIYIRRVHHMVPVDPIDLRTEYTPYAVRNSFNQNSRYNIIILPICVKLHYNYIILPFGIRHIIILCHVPRTFYLGTNNTFNCSSCKIGFYHEYCNIPMYTYACLYTIYYYRNDVVFLQINYTRCAPIIHIFAILPLIKTETCGK